MRRAKKRNSSKILLTVLLVLVCAAVASGDITDGLIAHWKLDSDATDSAGTNDGIIYGAVSTAGKIDGALSFDGVDDYVDVGDSLALTHPSVFENTPLPNMCLNGAPES